jgi:hypothetical protein
MPIVEDAQQTLQRFSKYVQELIDLFNRFDITGSKAPWRLWKAIGNGEFRKEWNRIWIEIAESEGGKLTLTTVLTITGAVLGGVGIAALGGAFGLPLALLFAPIGYLLGAEIDSMGLVRKIKAYLTGSGEPAAESPEQTSDIEQLAELVSTLLARCEQTESLVSGASSQIEDLEKRVVDATSTASALRSDVSRLERRTTYLSLASVVLAVLLIAHLVWDVILRGVK